MGWSMFSWVQLPTSSRGFDAAVHAVADAGSQCAARRPYPAVLAWNSGFCKQGKKWRVCFSTDSRRSLWQQAGGSKSMAAVGQSAARDSPDFWMPWNQSEAMSLRAAEAQGNWSAAVVGSSCGEQLDHPGHT